MGCVLIVLCLLQAIQCVLLFLSSQHSSRLFVCLFVFSLVLLETHDHIHSSLLGSVL